LDLHLDGDLAGEPRHSVSDATGCFLWQVTAGGIALLVATVLILRSSRACPYLGVG